METTVKKAIRDEKGGALLLTLVLLLVGGLIIAPLLGFMGTGLIAGQVHEKRMDELYAADAGVEDAMWKIQQGEAPVCLGDPAYSYNISDVNEKRVDVSIRLLTGQIYAIDATATANGSGTRIEAYAVSVYGNYTDITDNVLTSQAGIDYPPTPIVNFPPGHEPEEYYDGPWPELDAISAWYREDVKDVTPLGSGTIDLNGADLALGPQLYGGGTLDILNSSNTAATLTLTGTIYVTDDTLDTLIGKTGKKNMTLNLNGHAIFVESRSADPQKALWIGDAVTITGPGVIVAMGDIYFGPNMAVGSAEPIFIISIEGETTLQPNGDFYGAVAGSVEVVLQPNSRVTYPEDGFPDDLNWPGFDRGKITYAIDSWIVSTLTL